MAMATFSYIPEDILQDIFVRLPVKTLIRLRVVCKSWRSLITSPKFIKAHLEFSRAHSPRVLISNLYRKSMCVLNDGAVTLQDMYVPYRHNILGSANGLVCVDTIDSIHLWNPSTKLSRDLDKSRVNRRLHCGGFGFSHKLNDYKLVILQYKSLRPNLVAEIYTLGQNSWKKIKSKDMTPCQYVDRNPLVLKDYIYWIAGNLVSVMDFIFILAFDMVNDKFEMMQLSVPIFSARNILYSIGLVKYKEDLALFSSASDAPQLVDMWVMNDQKSWSKVLTSASFPKEIFPLKYWRENKVILENEVGLMIYDFISGELKNLPWSEGGYICIDDFVESLVPVDGKGGIIG